MTLGRPQWNEPAVRRFMKHVVKVDGREDSCWLWTAMQKDGYGYYNRRRAPGRGGKGIFKCSAHRTMYELARGPIPDGLTLDHLCRIPLCVNPSHLEAVTIRENCTRSPLYWSNRTHCKHGHEFDEANTRITPDGHRVCRECRRIMKRAYKFMEPGA